MPQELLEHWYAFYCLESNLHLVIHELIIYLGFASSFITCKAVSSVRNCAVMLQCIISVHRSPFKPASLNWTHLLKYCF